MVGKCLIGKLFVDGAEDGELVHVIRILCLLLCKVVGDECPCTLLTQALCGDGKRGRRIDGCAETVFVGITDKRDPFSEQSLLDFPERGVIAEIHLIQQCTVVAVTGFHVEVEIFTDLFPVGGFPNGLFGQCLGEFQNLDEFGGVERTSACFLVNELIADRCTQCIEEVHAGDLAAERIGSRLQLGKRRQKTVHCPAVIIADQR